MREWEAKFTPPGSKRIVLAAIPVLPAYQGKGIGLIRWGTSIADAEGVSDKGWTAFQKGGVGEVGRLDVELDDFAGEVEEVCVSLYATRGSHTGVINGGGIM
jgi:hypothetical protein